MHLLKKYQKEILFTLTLAIFYFALRLPNLTLQPIFADEAIYIRWAQVIRAEPTLRFLPLSDGKTPLFMWLMIPFFKLFDDPLFAGRLLSVVSGFFTVMAGSIIAGIFFNKRAGLLTALLLVITPFIVFFDRLALVDSMLAAFSLWSLLAGLLLVKYKRIDLAMVLGYLLGGSMLTKTSGVYNIIVLPVIMFTFNWAKQGRDKRLLQMLGLFTLAVVIAFGTYNILRLGPGFTNLTSRNQDYVFSPTKLIETPFDPFIPHARDLFDWSIKFLGLPLSLLVVYSVGFILWKRNRIGIAILGWSVIPLLIEMNFYRTFTARYVLSSIAPLIILAAFVLDHLLKSFKQYKIVAPILLISLLAWPVYFNYYLHTNLEKVPLPKGERRGYLEDWTAGYGFKEIAGFLEEKSKKEFIVVGTEGSFGTLPDGLQIYLDKNRQVAIIGGKATISAQLREAAKDNPTYFVANKSRYPVTEEGAPKLGLELLKEYPKIYDPNSKNLQDAILLFRVLENIPKESEQVEK